MRKHGPRKSKPKKTGNSSKPPPFIGPRTEKGQKRHARKQAQLALTLPDSVRQRKVNTPAMQLAVQSVCALVDPFCAHAVGVKYPDASSPRTLAYSMHYAISLLTNASGSGSILYVPGFTYGYSVSTVVGSSATTAALTQNNFTGINAVSYRIVSSGLRLRHVGAPLNASGLLHIRGFANSAGTNLNVYDIASFNCDFYQDIPLQAVNNNGHTDVILRRMDDTQARLFKAPSVTSSNNSIANYNAPGFGPVAISVSGAVASTIVIHIEVFQHIECLFADDDALAIAATPAPRTNEKLNQVAASVREGAGQVFTEVGRAAGDVVIKLAQDALYAAGASALTSYMAPAALALM